MKPSATKLILLFGFVLMELGLQYLAQRFDWGRQNFGFSFGLGEKILPNISYLALSSLIFLFLIWGRIFEFGWWLIVAGGTANGIFRVFTGHVWDYLQWKIMFSIWFNLADVAITTGVIWLIYNMVFVNEKD